MGCGVKCNNAWMKIRLQVENCVDEYRRAESMRQNVPVSWLECLRHRVFGGTIIKSLFSAVQEEVA